MLFIDILTSENISVDSEWNTKLIKFWLSFYEEEEELSSDIE
jgi:hypothetical protein